MGGRSLAGVSAAYDYSDALTRNVHAAANAVERSVIVAWNNYEATTAAISARQQQIAASEVALEGVREENNLGTRTNLDVLDAEQDLFDARVTLVQAERLVGGGLCAFIEHGSFDRCAPRYSGGRY